MASELIGLRIAISGVAEARRNIGVVQGDVGNLEKQIRSLSGTSQTVGRTLTSVGDTISRVGRDLTVLVSAPIGAFVGLLVRSGIQFEDTFAGIAKTVDGVAEVGADGLLQVSEAGAVLRDEIRKMALEIPIGANELNNIGQIAGQLGVRGTDNLRVFIETIAKMGVATNLSSQEAAFGVARLFNILDPVGREVQNVGEFTTRTAATIVDLGNNASATESEILDMALRLAGAGRVAGLTTPQILGFSASLAEIGVRAELGGTALSRVLQEMVFAIADGGGELESFAKLAGKTAADFAADFKGDPTTAMIEFIKKLAEAQEQGLPGLKDILDDVGLGGVRVRDVLNRLGGDTGVLTKNVNRANDAWEKQMALQIEAEKRFSTIQSKIGILKNRFVDLGITIFDLVREDLDKFLSSLGDVIDMFKSLDPNTQKLILTLTGIAIAIGPILAVLGILISSLGVVVSAIGALFSPVGALIAIVAAAVIGIGFLITQFIDIQDVIQGVIQFVKDLIDTISGLATGRISVKDILPPELENTAILVQSIVDDMRELASGQLSLASLIPTDVLQAIQAVKDQLDSVVSNVQKLSAPAQQANKLPVSANQAEKLQAENTPTKLQEQISLLPSQTLKLIDSVVGTLRGALESVVGFFIDLFNRLKPLVDALLKAIGPILEKEGGQIFENLNKSLANLGEAFSGLLEVLNQLMPILQPLLVVIGVLLIGSLTLLILVISRVINIITGLLVLATDLAAFLIKGVGNALEFVRGVFELLIGAVLMVINGFRVFVGLITGDMDLVQSASKDFADGINRFIGGGIDRVIQSLLDMGKLLLDKIPAIFTDLWNLVPPIFQQMVQAIIGWAQKLFDDLIGHSILTDLKTETIGIFTTIRDTIVTIVAGFIQSIIDKFTFMRDQVMAAVTNVPGVIDGIKNALQNLLNWLGSHISSIVGYFGQITGAVTNANSEILGSPKTKIQYALEDLNNFLNQNPFNLDMTPIAQTIANGTQPLIPAAALAGDNTAIDQSINFNGSISGVPMTDPGDVPNIILKKTRQLKQGRFS